MLNMLKSHAMSRPDQIAIAHQGYEISYADLYGKSVLLAGWFRQQGVEPEDRIVVAASRGIDTAIALYATLLCGATYVPLEHTYPAERITSLICEITPKVVIVDTAHQHVSSLPYQVLCAGPTPESTSIRTVAMAVAEAEMSGLAQKNMPTVSDHCLAYIMFTSGSTGRPKGVCIERESIFRFVEKYCRAMRYEHDIRMLGVTSLSGDGSMIQHLCVHYMGDAVRLRLQAAQRGDPVCRKVENHRYRLFCDLGEDNDKPYQWLEQDRSPQFEKDFLWGGQPPTSVH